MLIVCAGVCDTSCFNLRSFKSISENGTPLFVHSLFVCPARVPLRAHHQDASQGRSNDRACTGIFLSLRSVFVFVFFRLSCLCVFVICVSLVLVSGLKSDCASMLCVQAGPSCVTSAMSKYGIEKDNAADCH